MRRLETSPQLLHLVLGLTATGFLCPSLAQAHDSSAESEVSNNTSPADNNSPESDSRATRGDRAPPLPIGLWGRPVKRGGFHFQAGFGVGGGPDTLGIFHTMEIGYSWREGTIGMLHTFIQNKGVFGYDTQGPDLIGGWMIEYKRPILYPDLVAKVALGLGGTHDQSDGIKAHAGFGASYGIDLHFPVTPRFGPTLTLAAMHVTAEGQHHFGAGLALGITVF